MTHRPDLKDLLVPGTHATHSVQSNDRVNNIVNWVMCQNSRWDKVHLEYVR